MINAFLFTEYPITPSGVAGGSALAVQISLEAKDVLRVIERAIRVYREEGPRRLVAKSLRYGKRKIRRAWDQAIRPNLPWRVVSYNGVRVRAARWFDPTLPWYTAGRPRYEVGLLEGIQGHAALGDSVVIVGGGWGVSAVAAATQTGETGSVDVYEGSASAVEQVEETIRLNGMVDRVNVHHAVVGPEIQLDGGRGGARELSPEELPAHDVLVLDCEGAETAILSNLEFAPRTIVVETHGFYDSSEEDTKMLLEGMGYEIAERKIAEVDTVSGLVGGRVVETNLENHCRECRVFVLVGKKEKTG